MSDKLQKLLAHAGYGSRREIETWISDGRITVNGKRAKLGDRATASDRVLIDGKMAYLTVQQTETIKALIYHKPEGEICTRNDPKGRPTIFENLPAIPGGRSAETITKLTRDGVDIDGKPAKFDSVLPADMSEEGTNHWYRVVIREGRYREVRRMWDAVGHTVSRLKRIRYGTIRLTRDIKRGQNTKIAPMQLEKLVNSVDLQDMFGSQLYSSKAPSNKPAGRSRGKSGFKPRQGSSSKRQPSSKSSKSRPSNSKSSASQRRRK